MQSITPQTKLYTNVRPTWTLDWSTLAQPSDEVFPFDYNEEEKPM